MLFLSRFRHHIIRAPWGRELRLPDGRYRTDDAREQALLSRNRDLKVIADVPEAPLSPRRRAGRAKRDARPDTPPLFDGASR